MATVQYKTKHAAGRCCVAKRLKECDLLLEKKEGGSPAGRDSRTGCARPGELKKK